MVPCRRITTGVVFSVGMHTVSERCRAALLAKGLEATPENLSRVSGLPVSRAAAILAMGEPPEIVRDLGKVSRSLNVRMVWLTTGQTVPHITEAFRPEELAALDIAGELDNSGLRKWIRTGKHLIGS